MLFHPLYEKLCSDENLTRAWRAVRRHSEAPGIDGMTPAIFESRSFVLLKKLQNDLVKLKYRPQPVKRIFMKREVGPPRPLGIPTFTDRIVHRALVQILVPLFEPHFDDYSHAYRTGRSPQTAIAQARDHALAGRPWVIKIDLRDCFGNIPLRPLLRAVNRHIHDFAVRKLLKRLLAVEVITQSNSGLQQVSKPQGLLQGSPLSPLLANIYLDAFDKQARQQGMRFVRFGDDIAIFATTRQEAEEALDAAGRILEKLHLPLNREKTKLHHLSHGFNYLGEWLSLANMRVGERERG
ncbi:MAG: reverse transcriptase/maturase family protein [candidate division KSB1 bacterium]|nr:reverse transcriptase/maturase family protein [candidate division KSB1 bacterium]MDZ7314407.1 reverse transcriptase/maturase family protein [candidate division KSB1 bacterium]